VIQPAAALAPTVLLLAALLPAQLPVPTNPRPSYVSDHFAELFPSRVKTFIKAGVDPDDLPQARARGNDDGFSGQNLCEAYRTVDQGNPLSVLVDFQGRAGVMGMFFRNFWSDSGGVPPFPGELNRTRIWLDGNLSYDQILTDYFRNPNDPLGQIPPFSGPFTGHRSGGHFTHAQLTFNDSFRIGLWDDSFSNAARFHRVAVTLATPEGDLPLPDQRAWEAIALRPGRWPHGTARRAVTTTLQLPASGNGALTLTGPATLLELTCEVPQQADWTGLWARFTWDGQPQPAVDLPLRLLGGMIAPPYSFPMDALMFGNDGNVRVRIYLPMPFANSARLEFQNRNLNPVALRVTEAVQTGPPAGDWGYFHATYNTAITQTGVTFQGPSFTDCRGTLRLVMLEDVMDNTGRIPGMGTSHLEGDLCIRINGNRGDDHDFDASETSIGKWGWYMTAADQPFVSDTAFQTGLILRYIPGGIEARRVMGSLMLFDPVHFVNGIDIRLEHGVQNTANAEYGLVTFLYLQQGAARHTSLELDIGDPVAEQQHGVQFTQWSSYTRQGGFMRDQFYGTPAVTDTVRHVRDFLRFRFDRPDEASGQMPVCIGFRLDRLGAAGMALCQADVLVDGRPAGLLHVFTHNPTYPWKEGGEAEVELPRALTDGKASFMVEVRPRPGSDPLRIARIWVYEYSH
jgi:hypothetical protein